MSRGGSAGISFLKPFFLIGENFFKLSAKFSSLFSLLTLVLHLNYTALSQSHSSNVYYYYSGFRRKARVIKCNRFPRQKGGHGPRRSMCRLRKLGTRNTTLLACDRKFWQVSRRHKRSSRIQRCRSFSERLGPPIIFFKASQVSSCSKRQFSWDNNWADRMWLLLLF